MFKALLPFADIALLTIGSLLACMTQMEHIKAIPVPLAEVAPGSATVQHGELNLLVLRGQEMTLNGSPVEWEDLGVRLAGKKVVLRADKGLPVGKVWRGMAGLHRAGCELLAEVRESSEGPWTIRSESDEEDQLDPRDARRADRTPRALVDIACDEAQRPRRTIPRKHQLREGVSGPPRA
jgi:biopolymer transport protein ExbD